MVARLDPLRERFDAVLLDLDGTLLLPDGSVGERTQRAIRALVDAGMEVVLCTGRSVQGTAPCHRTLGLTTALVAYNGAWIGHPGRSPWRRTPIPDPLVPAIERLEDGARFSFRHAGDAKHVLERDHPAFDRVARWYTAVVRTRDPAALPRRDLMRVSCYFDDRDDLEAAWAEVHPDARAVLVRQAWPLAMFREFTDSGLHLCEVQGQSRGKAEALDYLREERGIPPERVLAIGDHVNDLPMFREAGFAVAVANADPEARRAAHLVIGDHEEEGIAAWIEAGAPLERDGAPAFAARSPGRSP